MAAREPDRPVDAVPPAGRPRFRTDLVVVRTTLGGAPAVVVADRAARRYVRLGEGADEILALLDGSRTVEELAAELGRRAEAEFPVERAAAFVEQLARRGFLEGVPGEAPKRVRGPLAVRWPLFNPDRLVGALRGLGQALFSTPAMVAALLLGVAGGVTLAVLGPAAAIPRLDAPWTLAAFYVAASLALTLHELGHALALKARGGVVHEAGVLLLFGMPCLYVDVSDAWLLREKRDRLVVSAAGLLVEAALFGAACLVLALAPLGGTGAVAAFAVASVCGVRSILVNLNPLVRLDGYYILSDLLGIPNLRPRAFALLLGRSRAGRRKPERRGERIVLAIYALLALPYGLLLATVLLWTSARWLLEHGGPLGLVAWSVVAALVLWRTLTGLLRTVRTARAEERV